MSKPVTNPNNLSFSLKNLSAPEELVPNAPSTNNPQASFIQPLVSLRSLQKPFEHFSSLYTILGFNAVFIFTLLGGGLSENKPSPILLLSLTLIFYALASGLLLYRMHQYETLLRIQFLEELLPRFVLYCFFIPLVGVMAYLYSLELNAPNLQTLMIVGVMALMIVGVMVYLYSLELKAPNLQTLMIVGVMALMIVGVMAYLYSLELSQCMGAIVVFLLAVALSLDLLTLLFNPWRLFFAQTTQPIYYSLGGILSIVLALVVLYPVLYPPTNDLTPKNPLPQGKICSVEAHSATEPCE